MTVDRKIIDAVLIRLLEKARGLELDAGYSGSMNDGGASFIRMKVEAFRHGLNGTLPEEWIEIVEQINAENDPDWGTYQKLKSKFEKP